MEWSVCKGGDVPCPGTVDGGASVTVLQADR